MFNATKYKNYSIAQPDSNPGSIFLVYDQLEAFQVPLESEKDAKDFIDMGEEYMTNESCLWTSGNATQSCYWKKPTNLTQAS